MQRRNKGFDYTEKHGSINYLNGKGLSRPLSIPPQQLIIVGLFVIIAACAGCYVGYNVYQDTVGTSQRVQAQVEENLSRDVDYDLPVVSSLVSLDDDAIRQSFEEAGLTTYELADDSEDAEQEASSASGFELVKFPSDLTLDEATELYEQGISNLGAADASLLLKGLWTIEVDRSAGIDIVVRYAYFSADSLEDAVDDAIEVEGFDTAEATEADTDDSGNTYRTGTMAIGGTAYTWRVSAIALDEIYSVSGLPDNAVYVGVRISA